MRIAAFLFAFLAPFASAAEVAVGVRTLAAKAIAGGSYGDGSVDIGTSGGFAATGEVFISDRLSTHLAASFLNPAAFLRPDDAEAIDLNTLGIDTYSATIRYQHPGRRFTPFAGAGAGYTIFGNLEERFGDRIEMTFENSVSWIVEGGIRYHVMDGLWIDAAVAWMPLEAERATAKNDTSLQLPERVAIDPVTISVGASWRW